tara:strand:+ start:108 stop:539 length:432 start_codon:yes stop_codon:yes gene_type:complete
MELTVYHKNDLIRYEIEKHAMFEIIYLRILKDTATEEEIALNIEVLESYIKNRVENNKCFYLFYDVEKIKKLVPMTYVYNIVKMFKRNSENLKKGLIKTFVINSSSVIIGISNIIFALYTPIRPYEFVKSAEEAKEKLFKLNN